MNESYFGKRQKAQEECEKILCKSGIFIRHFYDDYGCGFCIGNIEDERILTFYNVDLSEHDRKFTDKIEELKKENDKLKIENSELHCEIQAINAMPDSEYAKELEKQIEELELELSVKENLLKIKNGLRGDKPRIHIIGLREFGGEQYMRYSDVEDLMKELEN